jgi:predicted AlkP superfamily pyrophosphatase or phosphodiesterase
MSERAPVDRVVLVVLDGLRPDAIDRFALRHLQAATDRGAYTLTGRTVRPSVTAAAMGSLLTGASPQVHGLESDKFGIPRPKAPIHPVPRVLAEHGLTTSAFLRRMPWMFRGVARRITGLLGVRDAGFAGETAAEILAAARPTLARQRRGLVLMHWPDGDNAGHAHGWMSAAYGDAARRMDDAFGALLATLALHDDPSTLVIALADHGGGGAVPTHHYSEHPLDTTIPILLLGEAVAPGPLDTAASLLDVPATILWALGVPRPACYPGEPLIDAFGAVPALAVA